MVTMRDRMGSDDIDLALLLSSPRVARDKTDRRQVAEDGPPWVTNEGFVLEDRRSGEERRKKKI